MLYARNINANFGSTHCFIHEQDRKHKPTELFNIEQLNSSQIQEGQACVKEETNLVDKIIYRCIIRNSIPSLALNLDHKIKF
jgi:hypothetical protein